MGNEPPEVAGEVQKNMYRNRCGVRLGAHNAPDGEEAHNLFSAWEQIAPLLAYVEEDPTWQEVVGLRTLLRTLYSLIPGVPRPSCRRVAAAFREHCCGESGSHYLLFLEEDCDAMLERADACGVGLAAVSGDVVESTNYILKNGYNGHSARGGGAGKSVVEREAMVVQQVWEWWFLTFDLPWLQYNTSHTAACTAASLLRTTAQAPSTHAPSATQLSYSSPIHGRRRAKEAAGGEPKGDPGHSGRLSVCCCSRSYCVYNSAFIKPKLPSFMNYESIYELMNYEPLLQTNYEQCPPCPQEQRLATHAPAAPPPQAAPPPPPPPQAPPPPRAHPQPHAARPVSASRPAANSWSEESTDSSEQERKRRKEEKKKQEKKRKKEKKKEGKRKQKEAAGGRGFEGGGGRDRPRGGEGLDRGHDSGGGRKRGGFGCDPVGEGGCRPCMGPQPGQPAQRGDPPLGARSAGQWALPPCSPFFEPRGDLRYPALGILPPVVAPHPQQG